METTTKFPISKEEMAKRARQVMDSSEILEVEQRGNTMVMLFGHRHGHFVTKMTFFLPGEAEKAALHFKGEESGGSKTG